MKSLILVSICAALLTGCAAGFPVAEMQADLTAAKVCCTKYPEFSYIPLKAATRTTTYVDKTAPAFDFPSGKSFFRAFQIDTGPGRLLGIRSFFNGPLIGQYMQPVVLFLDESHQQISVAAPRLRFVEGNMFVENRSQMIGGVAIPERAKYVVVFTAPSDEAPGSAQMRPSVGVFMAGSTPIAVQNQGKAIPLTLAPVGELDLEIVQAR